MLLSIILPNSFLFLLLASTALLTVGLFHLLKHVAHRELQTSQSYFIPPTWLHFSGTSRLWGILCTLVISWCCLSWTTPFVELHRIHVFHDEVEEIVPPITAHPRKPIPPPPPMEPEIVEIAKEEDLFRDTLVLEEPVMEVNDSSSVLDTGTSTFPPILELPKPKEDFEELPFRIVSQMPRFPGCEDVEGTHEEKAICAERKLLDYIYSKISYPPVALENDVEGTAIVDFIIERDGTISDIEILRSPGAGTGTEVRKVIESMNLMCARWTPGRQQGRTVRVRYSLPVRFKLK